MSAIARRHLESRLGSVRARDLSRPYRGWIRAIRDALGMSAAELGERMGIVQSAVSAMERSETEGSIKLETLRRAAAALECDVVYAFVPRTSLEEIVGTRARTKAARVVNTVGHHMVLEGQAVYGSDTQATIDELAQDLIDKRGLWTDPA